MKKFVVPAVLVALGSVSMAHATATSAAVKQPSLGVVAIDSQVILQKSKEGKPLYEDMQREVRSFQAQVQKAQQDLVTFQESIAKQSKMLSKEALAEKTEELMQRKKDAERTLGDKEEALRRTMAKKEEYLREVGSRQMEVVNTWFSKEGHSVLIDKSAPGVLCVANAIDKTDTILGLIDKAYDTANKELATTKPATVTLAQNKTEATTETSPKGA